MPYCWSSIIPTTTANGCSSRTWSAAGSLAMWKPMHACSHAPVDRRRDLTTRLRRREPDPRPASVGDHSRACGEGADESAHGLLGAGRDRELEDEPAHAPAGRGDGTARLPAQGVLDAGPVGPADRDDEPLAPLDGHHGPGVDGCRHGVTVGADEAAGAEQRPAEPAGHDGHDLRQAAPGEDVEHGGACRARGLAVVVAAASRTVGPEHEGGAVVSGVPTA